MSNQVFNQAGVTVTKVTGSRLSGRKFTYTVYGFNKCLAGYFNKADAIQAARKLIADNI